MSAFFRVIKFAFQHFFRNFWLSLATVSILVLTLLTLNILLILNLTATAALRNVENRVDVSASFKVGTEETEVQNTVSYLRSLVEVKDVALSTPDEILAEFKTKHADNSTIISSLNEVGDNPFGYRLVIRANSVDNYSTILEALDNPSFRDKIEEKNFSDHEVLLTKLSEVTDKIHIFGFLLFAVFLSIAVLIVLNTVRVTIFVHREEIAIMRLVGATGWFIRAPYLVETAIFSLLAVFISAAIIVPIVLTLDPFFAVYFESSVRFKDFFIDQALLVFGLEFVGAALVCLGSTAVAMRKYLRV